MNEYGEIVTAFYLYDNDYVNFIIVKLNYRNSQGNDRNLSLYKIKHKGIA